MPSQPIAPGFVAWQTPSWKLGALGREMATACLLAMGTGLAVTLLALAWTWKNAGGQANVDLQILTYRMLQGVYTLDSLAKSMMYLSDVEDVSLW